MKKYLLLLVLFLVSCSSSDIVSQPIENYTDSYICYDQGKIVDSEESVNVSKYPTGSYLVTFENGRQKRIPVNDCYVTYGE